MVLKAPAGFRDICAAGAVDIVRRLHDSGHLAFLAGGCVRDMLLGRTPKDFDIATSANPDSVTALFPGSVAVGRSFGVVRVPLHGIECEVAMFRSDGRYVDGRRPLNISPALPREDAKRRDFTVNALFYDPVDGALIDYVGGYEDINKRILRAVGDPAARFAEDHLRLMRAARFSSVLGLEMAPETYVAVAGNAILLSDISAERIRDEFCRMLMEAPRPGDGLLLLHKLGLLRQFFPESDAMSRQEQPVDFHPEGDVLTHTAIMLNGMKIRDIRLALAIVLHDCGKPACAEVINGRIRFYHHDSRGAVIAADFMRRMRMSNEDSADVVHMVRNHGRMAHAVGMKMSSLRRLIGSHTFPLELELHRLDADSSNHDMTNYKFLSECSIRLSAEAALPDEWITGSDIIGMGVPEGPMVGRWKRYAYDMQLEGCVRNREDLYHKVSCAVRAGNVPCSDRNGG